MIGSGIYSVLKDSCSLVITYRNPKKLAMLYQRYGQSANCTAIQVNFSDWYTDYQTGFAGLTLSPAINKFQQELLECDWVINAMGVTKAIATTDPTNTLFINGAVPHILAALFNDRLIHITTDCVFDGTEGAPYDENSPKRPVDLYGLSKMIGEPDSVLVVRCSTIGPELGTKYGLLEWFLSQTNVVNGFTNHLWNGITAKELGHICGRLISGRVMHPGPGIYHIFSEDVTKADMLKLFRQRFGTSVEVVDGEARVAIDRRLATHRSLNAKLALPAIETMVSELLPVGLTTE